MGTATRKMDKQVFIANESFLARTSNGRPDGKVITDGGDGIDTQFFMGRTRVYEGADVLTKMPHLFDHIEDHDTPLN